MAAEEIWAVNKDNVVAYYKGLRVTRAFVRGYEGHAYAHRDEAATSHLKNFSLLCDNIILDIARKKWSNSLSRCPLKKS